MSALDPIYPWQRPLWQRLVALIEGNRLPHALLLHGPGGIGKLQLGRAFARALLCTTPDEDGAGCGECPACKLFSAGTHPDYIELRPPEGKERVVVDQVREMVVAVSYTPQISSRRVVLLHPAERMNRSAANSLLKTLEEPPGEVVIVLLADAPARLLPTIRSRCQQISAPLPTNGEAVAWLQSEFGTGVDAEEALLLASGAPLRALELGQPELLQHHRQMGEELLGLLRGESDPVVVARRWEEKGPTPRITLQWFQLWLGWLIRGLQRPALQPLQQQLAGSDWRRLFWMHDEVVEALRLVETPVNKRLLFEGLLLQWRALQ